MTWKPINTEKETAKTLLYITLISTVFLAAAFLTQPVLLIQLDNKEYHPIDSFNWGVIDGGRVVNYTVTNNIGRNVTFYLTSPDLPDYLTLTMTGNNTYLINGQTLNGTLTLKPQANATNGAHFTFTLNFKYS